MVVDVIHWVLGFLLALALHLAGMVWLDVGKRSAPLTVGELNEEIVVMLGEGSGEMAETAPLFTAAEETGRVEAVETVPQSALKAETPTEVEIDTAQRSAPPAEQVSSPTAADVETPDALDTALDRAPDLARADAAVTVESALAPADSDTVRALDIARVSEPPAETIDPFPGSEEGAPVPELIDIVTPEAPVLLEAEPDAPAVSTIETSAVQFEAAETEVVESEVTEIQPTEVSPAQPESPVPPEAETAQADRVGAVVLDLAAVETVVARDTAPAEVSEQQVARAVTLEELGLGGSGVVAGYAGLLKGRLQENMHYPRAARLAGQEGRAVVRFVIDRSGNVLSIELERASGHPILDRESIEMIQRADPFPRMPAEMLGSSLELRVPVAFEIREETKTKSIPPINLE